MDINFGNITYRNDLGEIVTKEEFEKERHEFERDVDEAYNRKANQIISKINAITSNDIQKLWLLYDYLTWDNMIYNLQGTTHNGRMASDVQYDFPPYKNWKISHSTKYPALLNNSGICKTYSLAFEDIANKLKIPCRVVTGYTGMEHAWNIVLINGEVKHIDVAYAIMRRSASDKKNFFLKSLDELIQYGGSRTLNTSIDELTNEMINQYKQLHPQIKVISRTDTEINPGITVIKRSDGKNEPKITILNRNDNNETKRMKR